VISIVAYDEVNYHGFAAQTGFDNGIALAWQPNSGNMDRAALDIAGK
jgi:hypothetical protein